MWSYRRIARSRRNSTRRGAMMMMVGVCIPVALAFGIFAINVAWMQLSRTELRTATDSAAKAGSRVLSMTQNPAIARQWAIDAASRNSVAGSALSVSPDEVIFGDSTENPDGSYSFVPAPDNSSELTSIWVTGSRTASSASGPVQFLFPGLFDSKSFEPVKEAVVTQIDRDVALVLDRSGSMLSPSDDGTRWDALEEAVLQFLVELNNTPQRELVAVATYASDGAVNLPLTSNYIQVQSTVAAIEPDGATAIGLGLVNGLISLNDMGHGRPLAKKTIVLMTDGNHNTGTDPVDVATQAATEGVVVHTITFGSGANQTLMGVVAQSGGGNHWHADDADSLVSIFGHVARTLPSVITK